MDQAKRDPVTGQSTTGHEWNGIEELNTPIPRVVLFFLAVATLFAVGLLAADAGLAARLDLYQGSARHRPAPDRDRAGRATRRPSAPAGPHRSPMASFAEIAADPALMQPCARDRRTLFADNCAVCHGMRRHGRAGLPQSRRGLLAVGRRARGHRRDHPRRHQRARPSDTRVVADDGLRPRRHARARAGTRTSSPMSARFRGSHCEARPRRAVPRRQGSLRRELRRLPRRERQRPARSRRAGPDRRQLDLWRRSRMSIYNSVHTGRQGHMPSWEGRLSPTEIKLLALYVGTLRAQRR